MQFLIINVPSTDGSTSTTLSDISDQVGSRNVDAVLALNNISRTKDIGLELSKLYASLNLSEVSEVDYSKKLAILNTYTEDSDVFEYAALQSEYDWKVLALTGSFRNTLKIPETFTIPSASNVIGNGDPISQEIYNKSVTMLQSDAYNHSIDPILFNSYDCRNASQIGGYSISNVNPIQWFKLPWGQISLYSSIGNESIDFPVYPEELKDSRQANYETMPDLIYQYEPFQVYKSSGPRTNTFTFKMHRDMWTGNHLDGNCNKLIRFCEANCFPEYNGASVQISTVSLYIAGYKYISGILTNVDKSWDGPIGQDGFYLNCQLELTIIEVSESALNYTSVKNKGLIS